MTTHTLDFIGLSVNILKEWHKIKTADKNSSKAPHVLKGAKKFLKKAKVDSDLIKRDFKEILTKFDSHITKHPDLSWINTYADEIKVIAGISKVNPDHDAFLNIKTVYDKAIWLDKNDSATDKKNKPENKENPLKLEQFTYHFHLLIVEIHTTLSQKESLLKYRNTLATKLGHSKEQASPDNLLKSLQDSPLAALLNPDNVNKFMSSVLPLMRNAGEHMDKLTEGKPDIENHELFRTLKGILATPEVKDTINRIADIAESKSSDPMALFTQKTADELKAAAESSGLTKPEVAESLKKRLEGINATATSTVSSILEGKLENRLENKLEGKMDNKLVEPNLLNSASSLTTSNSASSTSENNNSNTSVAIPVPPRKIIKRK